jgi:hypothetical protein
MYFKYQTVIGWLFRGELEVKVKKRITEVIAILNFSTNIICFSESANFSHRNFTVKEVLIPKKCNSLSFIYQNLVLSIKVSNKYQQNIEIFY